MRAVGRSNGGVGSAREGGGCGPRGVVDPVHYGRLKEQAGETLTPVRSGSGYWGALTKFISPPR